MFPNKGILALLIYHLATLINDPIVLYYGEEGFATPRQFAIIIGIFLTAPHVKIDRNTFFYRSIKWLLLFYLSCILSFLVFSILGKANDNYLLTLITDGANIIWLFFIGNVLSREVTTSDKKTVILCILLLGLIPLLSGWYEFFLGHSLMSGGFAEKGIGSFFWVRGFHNDKIDFVSGLAPCVFLSYILIFQNGLKSWYLIPYLLSSIFLILFTFSITGILGILGGLLILALYYGTFRFKIIIAILLILTCMTIFIAIETERGKFLTDQYLLKYQRQVKIENIASGNARYVMGIICIREFINNPIWGIGFGSHVLVIKEQLRGWNVGGNAHSILSVAADLGLIGSIPFVLFWMSLYRIVFLAKKKYSKYFHDQYSTTMFRLSLALSIFVLFNLLFYFHTIGNAIFILWPSIVYATFNVKDCIQLNRRNRKI